MTKFFSRRRLAYGFALLVLLTLSSGVTMAAGTTERVSVSSSGAEGNGPSGLASISANGQYVVFLSIATNLASGDTNGVPDLFVHNRVSGATEIVDLGPSGAEGYVEMEFVFRPSISNSGQLVAFESSADDLVASDTNGTFDVFVHDMGSGTTELVSMTLDGTQANGRSHDPTISPDGWYIVFTSEASNLVPGEVCDDTEGCGSGSVVLLVFNVGPAVNAGNNQAANVGETVSLSPATFTDPGALDTHTATIAWGDGSPLESGTVDQAVNTVSGSHNYTATGDYTVEVCVTDDDTDQGCDTFLVTVTDTPVNAAPGVDVGSDASVDEDSPFTGSGSFTDADSSSWTATAGDL